MALNIKEREDKLYNFEFGKIPNTQAERIAYILGKKKDNQKFNEMIVKEGKRIKRIKRYKVSFTLWKIVNPSARPRVNTQGGYINMYVPRAATNGAYFEIFYKESKLPYIDTPCELNIKIYEKTPTSFSIKNTVLAELGLIRPWKRTGDFDNYAKTIADCMQHGMLADDALVVDSHVSLYYSIKPHADIEVIYMKEFP